MDSGNDLRNAAVTAVAFNDRNVTFWDQRKTPQRLSAKVHRYTAHAVSSYVVGCNRYAQLGRVTDSAGAPASRLRPVFATQFTSVYSRPRQ